MLSKFMTAIVQIIALPVAIRALGNKQFVLYAMLASAVGWLSLVNIGIGPALAVRIAEATARKDRLAEKQFLTSALLPILSIVFFIGIVFFFVIQYARITSLFGQNYIESGNIIKEGISVLVVLFLLQTVLSVVEAAQLGYQEQYILNLMAMASNMVCIIAIIFVAKYKPSVIWMIFAVNIPPFIFRIANVIIFFVKRSFLLPSINNFSWTVCKSLLSNGFIFSLAGGLGNFLCHQFPVIMAGRDWSSQDATSFAVAMNALIIASGMISMVTISLWPAISDSIARGEHDWVRLTYRRILMYSIIYGTFVGVIFAVFGTRLFRLWYGQSIYISQPLGIFLGLYFVLLMLENATFTMLIGMKLIIIPSILYLARSIFSIILMLTLLKFIGTSGPFISLCISVCIFTLVPFTLLSRHALREQKTMVLISSN